ncbi:hypothetical protein VCSRO39_3359 [Vibrio cholerae]|nr:hypothetical protein VCSRO39_3359 [Vibrio cholerae]
MSRYLLWKFITFIEIIAYAHSFLMLSMLLYHIAVDFLKMSIRGKLFSG